MPAIPSPIITSIQICKCNSKSTRKNRSFAYHPPSRFDLTVSLCSFRLSYGLTFNDLSVLELHLGFWRVDSVELFSMPGQSLSGLFSACLTFLQDSLKMHWFLEVKGLGFLYADHRNRADSQRPVVLRSLQGRNLTRDSSALTTALHMFDVCFKCEGGSVNQALHPEFFVKNVLLKWPILEDLGFNILFNCRPFNRAMPLPCHSSFQLIESHHRINPN